MGWALSSSWVGPVRKHEGAKAEEIPTLKEKVNGIGLCLFQPLPAHVPPPADEPGGIQPVARQRECVPMVDQPEVSICVIPARVTPVSVLLRDYRVDECRGQRALRRGEEEALVVGSPELFCAERAGLAVDLSQHRWRDEVSKRCAEPICKPPGRALVDGHLVRMVLERPGVDGRNPGKRLVVADLTGLQHGLERLIHAGICPGRCIRDDTLVQEVVLSRRSLLILELADPIIEGTASRA